MPSISSFKFQIIAIALIILLQTSAPRAQIADVSSPANFDVRIEKDSASDAYMKKFAARQSDSAVSAKLKSQSQGVARLQSRFQVDVASGPEMNSLEIVSVKPGTGFLTPASPDRPAAMRAFLSTFADAYGLSTDEVSKLVLVNNYLNPAGNMAWVEFEQRVNGLPVFRGVIRGGFTARGELARTTGPLAGGLDSFVLPVTPTITAADAVSRAAANVGWNVPADSLTKKAVEGSTTTFARGLMADDAKAWLLYFPLASGVARLAWAAQIWGDRNAFLLLLDAEDGTVLFRKDLTQYQNQAATYYVYNDDNPAPLSPTTAFPGSGVQPNFISRTPITLVGNEPPNTFNSLGWMTDGTNLTDGNNVEAGIDRDGINGVDAPVQGVNRVFNFTYNPLTDEPVTGPYQNGEVTDAFYWTNYYHDRLYLLGFTEAARNFQNNNFGRGGSQGDRVSAEMQDSSGTNNANFSTPIDGSRGRMQMYLFPGPAPDRTSGLEHDVLLHELTHGTSNRLHNNATGLTTQMAGGMGEGWSDFYARALLSTAADDPNGVYSSGPWVTYQLSPNYTDNYYYGIRRFPYAVKSSVGPNGKPHNPLTFADIDTTQINLTDGAYSRGPFGNISAFEVHNAGEVWCMTLLEVRARFITRLGYATGNQRFLQFVTDGMKLDPANPTFLQGRDSIIAAANAGGGPAADVADIWGGFAVRGMCVSAQVVNAATGRVVEAFDTPGLTAASSSLVLESIPNGRLDPDETVMVSLCIINSAGTVSGSVTGTLLSTGGVLSPSVPQSYGAIPPGATICQDYSFLVTPLCMSSVTATLQVQESGSSTRDLTYSMPFGIPATIFSQDFDTAILPALPSGWTKTNTGTANPWYTSSITSDTAPNDAFVGEPSSISDSALISPSIAVPAGLAQLTFRHYYNLESTYDGGVLEIAIGGGPFQDIIAAGGSFVTGGYTGPISTFYGSAIAGRQAWSGSSSTFVTTTVNLPAAASGQSIKLAWRAASDNSVSWEGWAVDTVIVAVIRCGLSIPSITAINPVSGAPGTSFDATITGTNLTNASAVTFSGSGVTATVVPGGTSNSLPISISVSPNAAPGLRIVSVTTPSGVSFPLRGFTVTAFPVVTSVYPDAGAPGTSLSGYVFGSNLGGASAVTFSGTGVTATIGSGNSFYIGITISIAVGAPLGQRTVTVTTPAGTSPPFSGFMVTTIPAISGFAINTGAQAATYSNSIYGTVLSGATAVNFSGTGVSATIQSGGTATSLPLMISVDPSAVLGPRMVTVTAPGGTSPPATFTVVVPPVITGITPIGGAPGSIVNGTITGISLLNTSAVTVSGTGVTMIAGTGGATAYRVPVTITIDPGAALGLRTFTVNSSGATSPSFSGFTITNTTTVTAMSPTIVGRGTSVNGTITGVALSGASLVTFSGTGVTASILGSGSSTSLPVSISIDPAASFGTRSVTVTASAGTSPPFSGLTVAPPSTITGISPNSAGPGANVGAIIDGIDLAGASAVTFIGTGVSAIVEGGGTSTSLPITIFISANAPLGLQAFQVTTPAGLSPPFSGFVVGEKRRSGQVTSAELFDDWPALLQSVQRGLNFRIGGIQGCSDSILFNRLFSHACQLIGSSEVRMSHLKIGVDADLRQIVVDRF
jgi:hypothetical protein